MKKNEGNFIKVYNVFTTLSSDEKENPYQLNEKELYVYSYLYMQRNLNGEVETAYDALKLFVTLTTRRMSDNKKEIIVQMESLINKGIINVEDNNGALTVSFNEINGGFEQVLFSQYNAMDMRQFFMFCAVKKWERATTGAIYAVWQWGKLLSLKSDRRVKDILNDACNNESGFLVKRIGAYSRDKKIVGQDGQVYQDANNYFPNYEWFEKVGKAS